MLVLTAGVLSGFAQTATFSDLRLEHNATDPNNGRTLLKFHYQMHVSGALGHKVHAVMFVDIPAGTGHKFANGSPMKADANTMDCSGPDTYSQGDWWVGVYNDQLNPLPGKNTYYTRLFAWDETLGRYIGNSEFLTFDMTGSQPSAPAPSGGGVNPYYNPAPQRITCGNCSGTGKCSNCHGSGISPYNVRTTPCGACGGRGICTSCHGTGTSGIMY